jgi:hypothetical protein
MMPSLSEVIQEVMQKWYSGGKCRMIMLKPTYDAPRVEWQGVLCLLGMHLGVVTGCASGYI